LLTNLKAYAKLDLIVTIIEMKAKIFWLTGLSGSGKSTISDGVNERLQNRGYEVKIVDGDDVRESYSVKLGFSREDVIKNNLLIGNLCIQLSDSFDVILVPVISPYQETREIIKNKAAGNLFHIYCNSSIGSVVSRDVKGLYNKAKKGEITDMIGYSKYSVYEPPEKPDHEVDTDIDGITVESATNSVLNFILSHVGLKSI
jgi:adenylylsulfate kinase